MSFIFKTVSHLGIAKCKDAKQLSPLVLAYMGDTVYDLYVRAYLIQTHDDTARGLHKRAAKIVCAGAQAKAAKSVYGILTPDEEEVYKRGRNAHMGTIPKNASLGDYKAATGLEAVIGYLYLNGRDERLNEIIELILSEEK